MSDPNAEAAMRKFIQASSLTDQFEKWLEDKLAAKEALSKPAIYVAYTFERRKRRDEELINITPWLRTATDEEAERIMAVDCSDLISEDHKDFAFLDGIITEMLDPQQQELQDRCQSNSIFIDRCAERQIRNFLTGITPLDDPRQFGLFDAPENEMAIA